jgi:aryl-alcohol dehydrogenase-like predicted oxidoreductase
LGITFLDTADAYGFGDNEELVGKTIKRRRDEVFLATRFANIRKKDDPTYWVVSGNPEYVHSACNASLKRLGVDRSLLSASRLALAWVLAKGEDLVPIPGTKHRNYLEESAAANLKNIDR